MDPAIEIQGLSKTYRRYRRPIDRIRERLPWNRDRCLHKPVYALKDVTATIEPGQCVGVIGGNGAGKSTLLKVLARTTYPTAGSFKIRGNVASLLELGAGFQQNFSGRENIFMNAALMGFSRKETEAKYRQILDFSELGEFIDAPIRTYSSGMRCRLGFSVAVATDPDVLIIDEILAVGDMHFRRKCIDRIMDFKSRGKTMLFCSHSLYDVRQICESAIWLKGGEVQLFADSVSVTNEYATYENQLIAEAEEIPWGDRQQEDRARPRRDDELPRVVSAYLVDPTTGAKRNTFAPGEAVGVRAHVVNGADYEPLRLAVGFHRKDGTLCFAPTTEMDDVDLEFQEGVVTLVLPDVRLLSGEFLVPVFLLDIHGVHRFHELPCEENLVIQNRDKELGLFRPDRQWQVEVIQPAPVGERSR